MSKRDAIIFDVDGTLANCEHRRDLLPNWDSFFGAMDRDTPNKDVVWLFEQLQYARWGDGLPEFDLFIATGRPEKYRGETEEWLGTKTPITDWEAMYMRADNDTRSDVIVKREILNKIRETHNVRLVVDDRQSVVDMWRAEGITCLQCNAGDFDTKVPVEQGVLTLMVGPSGAGKSTWVDCNTYPKSRVVSSDAIREELCGDFRDQSKNDQVFQALHAQVKAMLDNGRSPIVDATNIRNKDRTSLLAHLNRDGKAYYYVIDRPENEKFRDGGWRNEVKVKDLPLIRHHENTFQSNLKAILSGDGDPRVTVIDLRSI